MNTTELDAKKARLVKRILNDIQEDDQIDKLQVFLNEITQDLLPPCRFSDEELQERILQGELDMQRGLGVSQDEMRKRVV